MSDLGVIQVVADGWPLALTYTYRLPRFLGLFTPLHRIAFDTDFL